MRLSLDEIAVCLAPFGVALYEAQLEAVSKYVELLEKWNGAVNLTAINDSREIVARHFGESMFAASVVPFARGGRLADVGSGAGFPGLALKIALPQLDVVLIEPNLKKCAFLTEVTRALGLSGVDVVRKRYEEIDTKQTSYDFMCCRAIGDYRSLLRFASMAMAQYGMVVFWIGTEDSIRVGRNNGWRWCVPTRIPESRRRVLLAGSLELAP